MKAGSLLCTSASASAPPSSFITTPDTPSLEQCNSSSSKYNLASLTGAAAIPLALGVVTTLSYRILLWRARFVATLLDEDGSRVWSDGSMMVSCITLKMVDIACFSCVQKMHRLRYSYCMFIMSLYSVPTTAYTSCFSFNQKVGLF